MLCLYYEGIKVLMVRAHYPELTANLIDPILAWLPSEIYSYNGSEHKLTFFNGSVIKFGHFDSKQAENEYQGTEYDCIFLEEATQLSERAFLYLRTCCRGVNDFPKRIYLTCNPGGVGHLWVKRLFIDRKYITDPDNPEKTENPEDYYMIRAGVDDNPFLMEKNPDYVQVLAKLPPDLMMAHRYGDWDALSGAYFSNFNKVIHTRHRFKIPLDWPLYRSFDYGLDSLAICWWAVDQDGRSWCFRYYEESGLVIRDAAKKILDKTLSYERIAATYGPPDMWKRSNDTGKSMAEIFMLNGVGIVKADNNRVQGHKVLKDLMSPIPLTDPYVRALYGNKGAPDTLPGIMFFDDLKGKDGEDGIIEDISCIQADEKNPDDCAKEPHDVTHSVDAARYYAISRVQKAVKPQKRKKLSPFAFLEEATEPENSYESYLTGGEITESYMA